MKHINLRLTHRLLFRIIFVKALFSFLVGLGIFFLPQSFFASPGYISLNDLFPAPVWGLLWMAAGGISLAGILKLPYNYVRAGLASMTALYATWGTGLLANQIINVQPYSLLAVFVYFGSASVCAFLMLEPPINPVTAVKVRDERTE